MCLHVNFFKVLFLSLEYVCHAQRMVTCQFFYSFISRVLSIFLQVLKTKVSRLR